MKNVLLVNPPGTRPYLRDYYCSKVSKAGYLYHPVDLTFQSALLAEKHRVHVIDAIASKMSPEDVFRNMEKISPDAVLCMVGAAAWNEDKIFIRKLRNNFQGSIIGTGDLFLDDPVEVLEALPELNAALLDFTSTGLTKWIARPDEPALDMVIRIDGDIIEGPRSPQKDEFSIGLPLYDLFPHRKYRYPFVRRRPFATVLTDYGCPFPCRFCIMNTVGYRTRPIEEVMEELVWLKQAGYRELYFSDHTFGAAPGRTLELLDSMRREKLDFGWVCFTRTDVLNDDLAISMKEAGCHTVMFGVENADKNILDTYKKGTGADNAFKAINTCRKLGLRTVATFLIGFPEDTDSTIEATIRLALELDPDYASFNFAVPRRGTGLRRHAIELGLADPAEMSMDQAGEEIAMPTKSLSKEQMATWRKKALKRFYLRPGYIIKRAMALRTPYEAATTVLEGINVVRNAIFSN